MARSRLLGISVGWLPLAFLFDGVTVLLLPTVVGTGPGAATSLGLLTFTGLALGVAVQPVIGHVSDRHRARVDRRIVLWLACVPIAAGLALLGQPGAVVSVVVGYLAVQLGAGAFQAMLQTFISEHAPARQRGRAAGLRSLFDVGGAFLAFLILGALLGGGRIAEAVVVIGVLTSLAAGMIGVLVPRTGGPVRGSVRGSGLAPGVIPEGFARLVAARFLFLLGIYGVGRFLLLLVAQRLGLDADSGAAQTGALLATFTVVTAVAAVPLGALADRWSPETLMGAGVVLAAAGIALFVPDLGLPGIVVAGVAMSLGTAAFVPANWAATAHLAPPEAAGRLMGIASLGTGAAAAAAGLLGPMIDAVGFGPALSIAAVAALAAALPLMRLRPVPARGAA